MTWTIRTMHSDHQGEHDQKRNLRRAAPEKKFVQHPGGTLDEHYFVEVREEVIEGDVVPLKMVRCGCGALKPTDMMRWIGDHEQHHKDELIHNDDYACDNCFHRMVAAYGHEETHRCCGMPDEHLEHYRKMDRDHAARAPHHKGFRKPPKRGHGGKGLDKQ